MSEKERGYSPEEEFEAEPQPHGSTEKLRQGAERVLGLALNQFEVEGREQLDAYQGEHPEAKFIIAQSHLSQLDGAGAIRALGDKYDLQLAVDSQIQKMPMESMLFKYMGKEDFTFLHHTKVGSSHIPTFDVRDFDELSDRMQAGKTPWIAVSPFSLKSEKMRPAGIGAVYLAHKTGSRIVPSAFALEGGSVSYMDALDWVKAAAGKLRKKNKGTYRIGQPMELEPIENFGIIEQVFRKRADGEKVSLEEREEFSRVHKKLKEQEEIVARVIAAMLPEEQRGMYGSPNKPESS